MNPPRYEAREMPSEARHVPVYGIWDWRAKEFVIGEEHTDPARAIRQAAAYEHAYRRTL